MIFLLNSNPQLKHEKNIRLIPVEGHSTNYFLKLSRSSITEILRNCHNQKEPKDTQDSKNVILYPKWDLRKEKMH